MNPLALVFLPIVVGLCLAIPRLRAHSVRALVGTALSLSTLALAGALLPSRELSLWGYARLDATSRLFLALINPIFLGVSAYVASRVAATPALQRDVWRFAGLALIFLGAANAAVLGNHLLVFWFSLF